MVYFGRAIGKVVAALHDFVYAQLSDIQQVVLEVVGLFQIEVKKSLVFGDGAAQCRSNLVPLETVLHRVAVQIQRGKRRRGIHNGARTSEVKRFSRPIVGARTREHIDDAIAGIAPFGGVVIGQYGDVFHKSHGGIEFHIAQKTLVVVQAIDEVIGKNPVEAIDADIGPFSVA